jgi:adenylate cyclase
MGKEIERKFLVHADIWSNLEKPKGNLLRQGYLTTEPHKTIRVRATNDKGFITIKGISIGATRAEYEYEIPKSEAIELLDQFAENEIAKIRFEISFDSKIWEVDVFSGANEGLIVAEIELESEQEVFTTPDWVAQEVTEDKRYFNSNLSLHPFKEW